ncbi:hypothetical protein [Deinococcus radiodurans]|jgi:hypothetical protein|uniref:Uncharacterized protein n=1 Tax=Deinococcus radiodurans (strain ATCC 13939 / DSM 20539 / JCM 16871 / CCUG 27074 / LMG 4051 / NBRC 15346 / NCIMB 9279 / VKM B-1422 / R1) TaxID=243230 RepID=Q9RWF5_DEIRA|nr:hypothetical protein [Deinococcus radiodurans]AAF10302.1 hypothetical protein DR_0714 [Deinococcus radiodurans R1 = ATCC 13939 = DSM 20539]ANC72061.1 hypothetical protein A2G07_09920 [Deinococcus radiodurans R1 = ATCC 13939 = DSM 20539]QEM72654.1 hypothetical protein DXG80_13330 [Deinococcus radiodurans]UDK99885.1 hypothetical protein E5E91_03725 [Deinococcus radiodurans R1 = ATCC 13939 = DSM 20539]UID69714.1 hypothetical protein DRO_0712 [Deinococcus radiodurans R1 = ATCC 13939 = DSM 20539
MASRPPAPPTDSRNAALSSIGAPALRELLRPQTAEDPRDPWAKAEWTRAESSAARWQRRKEQGQQVARRGVGLAVLLALAGLGALVLLPLLVVLGIGVANGSAPAGWLLGAALLLGLLGLLWTGWRAAGLLRAPLSVPAVTTSPEEGALLTLLREHERALPPATRPALHATVIATRDALRATAGETTLSRAAFDAQQAAREDLPDLLAAYQALPSGARQDEELLGQLARIETRMAAVTRERAQAGQRALRAHGQYLDDKYEADSEP